MNDSIARSAQVPTTPARWLLLIHQLPPKPDYLRVKMRRRLLRLGAAQVKSTVYVLPNSPESLEDFIWLAREIRGEGGAAIVCEARFIEGVGDEEIEAMLENETRATAKEPGAEPDRVQPGRTWVTRQSVFVDRIGSAWLIRRFIDPRAAFKFVPPTGYTPSPGELRFDMYEAEYTHEGDRCTFQTLVARFGLADAALEAVGEIVHDIDCKDEKFGRPETQGVARLLRGIADSTAADQERIERGSRLFDDLYASFQR
jgi:hypothetical protein